MSDTNIRTSDRKRLKPRRKRRRGSLTLIILAVNIIAPLVLMVGLLYMGQYRDNLIRAELETLRAHSQLFAGAIAEGAVRPVQTGRPFLFARPEEIEMLIPELSRRMVRRLGETSTSRTRLFDDAGVLIGDSHQLIGPGGIVQIVSLEPPEDRFRFGEILHAMALRLVEMLPNQTDLKTYPHHSSDQIGDYPDALASLRGRVSATAWQDSQGRIILTAAAPVQKFSQVLGVVLLTREAREIEEAMNQLRFEVLTLFSAALAITIFLSLYLAGIIGRPLKKLALAAEAVRSGKGREIDIPDLTHRHDEIGELSESLRDMTQALWDRMDTIERFAADVAHEIKNPLTSLRSAVETAAVVKDPAKRDRLMEIIAHDVQRLDRLISDISNASRLDAELSRDAMEQLDLGGLLQNIVNVHRTPLERAGSKGKDKNKNDRPSQVRLTLDVYGDPTITGNEGRLAQVFDNLLTNAISFSPPDGTVHIRVEAGQDPVRITIEDQGPGIPESKLETIFERFYTERPSHEDYGSHSGLGLSIARQIVNAHRGRIWAENITEDGNKIQGARFVVLLPKQIG